MLTTIRGYMHAFVVPSAYVYLKRKIAKLPRIQILEIRIVRKPAVCCRYFYLQHIVESGRMNMFM